MLTIQSTETKARFAELLHTVQRLLNPTSEVTKIVNLLK